MGDDEVAEEDLSSKAENILKKLQAEAAAKRLHKSGSPFKDTVFSKNSIKTVKHAQDFVIENEDASEERIKDVRGFQGHKPSLRAGKTEAEDTEDIKSQKHKRKKHKHSESLSTEDLDSVRTKIKEHKKKKEKYKHNKTEKLTGTLGTSGVPVDNDNNTAQSSNDMTYSKKRKIHKVVQPELSEFYSVAGLYPGILGKGPWAKLGKNYRQNTKIGKKFPREMPR